MGNFTTKQGFPFYCYAINEKQQAKINQFLEVLEDSGVAEIISEAVNEHGVGRPSINPYAMFAVTLYGFTFG